MITRQSCKTSDVLMGTPSFHRREQEGPPEWRSHRLPLQAALKDDSFLVPVYHSFQHFEIFFAFPTSQPNHFLLGLLYFGGFFVGGCAARPYRRLRFWQNCLPWVTSCWLLKKSRPQDILLIERALPAAGQPPYVITRSNRTVGTAGGYFFLPLCTDHNNTHAREGTGLAARPFFFPARDFHLP